MEGSDKSDKERSEKNDNDISILATAIINQQKRSTLPARERPKFSGDPLEYYSFCRAFEYTVERKTDDEMEKLHFLDECTVGEPNRLVKGYLSGDPSTAFKEVKSTLKKRYGNNYTIVAAFKEKADRWPDLKRDDAKGFTSFSIFLSEYLKTVEDIDCLPEVNHSGAIKTLLDKLPYYLRVQWRILVDTLEVNNGKIAGFKEFVEFVEKQTRIMIVCEPNVVQLATVWGCYYINFGREIDGLWARILRASEAIEPISPNATKFLPCTYICLQQIRIQILRTMFKMAKINDN